MYFHRFLFCAIEVTDLHRFPLSLFQDVKLVFANAKTFNPEGHFVHEYAKTLHVVFELHAKPLLATASCGNILSHDCRAERGLSSANAQKKRRTEEAKRPFLGPEMLPRTNDRPPVNAKAVSGCSHFRGEDQCKASPAPPRIATSPAVACGEGEGEETARGNCDNSVNVSSGSTNVGTSSTERTSLCGGWCSVVNEDESNMPSDENPQRNINDHTLFSCAPLRLAPKCRASVGAKGVTLGQIDDDYIKRLHEKELEFSADDMNKSLQRESFDSPSSFELLSPPISAKDTLCIFSDVGKAVQRIQEDLMVIRLAPFDFASLANNTSRSKSSAGPSTATQKSSVVESGARRVTISYKRHVTVAQGGLLEMPSECLHQMERLSKEQRAAQSDPDPIMCSPFADSRHTFLEMCQFRNYQFDSLRRAKHSSLMILYHLHHPYDPSCRPICSQCQKPIQSIRWHCDSCPDFDLCSLCHRSGVETQKIKEEGRAESRFDENEVGIGGKEITINVDRNQDQRNQDRKSSAECVSSHQHELTPFRVTFL